MDEASIRNIVQQELRKLVSAAYQTKLDQAYPGGNPKTDDVLSGTAGVETSYPLMPLAYRYAVASEPLIMLPFGSGKVAAGLMEPLHNGLPASGAYWFLPKEFPETETTITTQGAALRLRCPGPFYVTRATIEVTTLQAASTGLVKIYSSDGVLLWTSGALATTGTGFVTSIATDPGVWLNPGFSYIVEYSNDVAGVIIRAVSMSAGADNHLNAVVAQRGTSALNIVANTPDNSPLYPRIKLF